MEEQTLQARHHKKGRNRQGGYSWGWGVLNPGMLQIGLSVLIVKTFSSVITVTTQGHRSREETFILPGKCRRTNLSINYTSNHPRVWNHLSVQFTPNPLQEKEELTLLQRNGTNQFQTAKSSDLGAQ